MLDDPLVQLTAGRAVPTEASQNCEWKFDGSTHFWPHSVVSEIKRSQISGHGEAGNWIFRVSCHGRGGV